MAKLDNPAFQHDLDDVTREKPLEITEYIETRRVEEEKHGGNEAKRGV